MGIKGLTKAEAGDKEKENRGAECLKEEKELR